MTAAQEAALSRVAAATEPIKLLASTARVLHEQRGYIAPEGDGWVLAPQGRAHLAARRARERQREVSAQLGREDREWAERVVAWLRAHRRISRRQYEAWRYAEHVAACDHAGLEPVAVGAWAEDARVWVEQAVRAAARCLEDFDKEIALAGDRGVGVSVSYEADPKVPKSRRSAATEASASGVISLRAYRERRPSGSAA